jgi:hypothetical protein
VQTDGWHDTASHDVFVVMSGGGFATEVELENTGNHDNGLGPVAVFKHCEAEGLGAVDKQAAAGALFVLDDPLSAAISADAKVRVIDAGM